MHETLDKGKVRKAVLLYLSQKIGPNNFVELQKECHKKDPGLNGYISVQDFYQSFEKAQMNVLPREFEELLLELDPKKSGQVNYD
jgi:Ca2+-binding EF-hand superfamily protein